MREIFNPELKAHLSIDNKQKVRSIRHSQEYWVSDKKSPLPAAIDYVDQMADLLHIPKTQLKNMHQKVQYLKPLEQQIEYRLSEQKQVFDSTSLGFYQTYMNIPVWQAGLKVTIKHAPYRVIRSVNTSQDGIDAKLPSQRIFNPYINLFSQADIISQTRRMAVVEEEQEIPPENADFIRKMLGMVISKKTSEVEPKDDARLIRGRLYVYKYDKDSRLPKDSTTVAKNMEAGGEPVLPLPPVDKRIRHGHYYIVAEVTFSYTTPEFGNLTWRMLVELETGSVLYLRALVGSVKGYVFRLDPISATGDATITADQNNTVLNAERDDEVLNNLDTPTDGAQSLQGTYANLTDLHDPTIVAPTKPTGTNFYYDVRTNDFAAVSAYFHVNRFFEVIESLGFSPISTYFGNTIFPIQVDHRGFGGVSNAHCVGDGMGGIGHACYGLMDNTGGEPLGRASDPRVHWHELGGHGVLYEYVDGPNFGFSHSAGDGLSGIYFDPESQAPGDLRFEYVPWHGTLRRRFDRDVADGWAWGGSHDNAGYGSEEILATTLFRIYQSIGGDSSSQNRKQFASRMMLYLILRAIQNLSPGTNPDYARDFAAELMTVDLLNWTSEGIYGGAYNKVIRWSFEKQGEYQNPLVERTDALFGTITNAGEPPTVDVYIDDGRQGEYQFKQNHWNTTTIWNRLNPDGVDVHEPPVLDETNYAYVKIKNRGTQQATNVIVRGYHSKPLAGINWPNDLQPFTTAEINAGTLNGNNAEEKIVGPFEWTPIINAYGHDCMLMIVSATEDPSNVDNFTAGETIPAWRLVPNDNNIGQRNVQPVPGGGGAEGLTQGLHEISFWVGNPNPKVSTMKLDVQLPKVLTAKGWRLSFKGIINNQFELRSGKQREIVFDLKPGQDFSKEEIKAVTDRDISIYAYADDILVGGMTYRLDPSISKPYDTCKPKCLEEAQDLLKCLNIKDQKVKKVKVKNVIVDIKLDDDDCNCR